MREFVNNKVRYLLLLVVSVLLVFGFVFNLYSYQYVIDKNGISFYDRAGVAYLKDSWSFPSKESLICYSVSSPIKDPLGGRGVLKSVCFSYYSPIGICRIRTFNFDQSNWAYFKIKSFMNDGFVAYCYKVYLELKNYNLNVDSE